LSRVTPVITELHRTGGFAVAAICSALGVPRSSYYAAVARADGARAEADSEAADEVEAIFREHRRRYGARRISDELARRGRPCGRTRVRRLMRSRSLTPLKTPAKFKPSTSDGGASPPAPNLLLGRDAPAAIDECWVADITYIPLAGGTFIYLASIMDRFSRLVVGWKLGSDLRATLVTDALAMAVRRRRPAPGLIIHTDQGSQYSSGTYLRRLAATGALASMSRRGNCYDNAFMESCFGTLKDEMLDGGQFTCFADAHTELFDYIENYYNRRRIHSSLGRMTPEEFENKHRKLADS
jgi:putative transposase